MYKVVNAAINLPYDNDTLAYHPWDCAPNPHLHSKANMLKYTMQKVPPSRLPKIWYISRSTIYIACFMLEIICGSHLGLLTPQKTSELKKNQDDLGRSTDLFSKLGKLVNKQCP
jgi:hypothetical protein